MVSTIKNYFKYSIILIILLGLGSLGLMLNFTKPGLPDTSLKNLQAQTYLMSIREIANTSPGQSTEIVLSPAETSFLAERYHPDWSSYGLTLEDLHVEAAGNQSRIRAVFSTPIGVYLLMDFRGQVRLTNDSWTIEPSSLVLGSLPVSFVLPSSYHPDWPSEFPQYDVNLRTLELDGKGLRVVAVNQGWDFSFTNDLLD